MFMLYGTYFINKVITYKKYLIREYVTSTTSSPFLLEADM